MEKENCLICHKFWECKNRNEKAVCKGYETDVKEEQLPGQMSIDEWLGA